MARLAGTDRGFRDMQPRVSTPILPLTSVRFFAAFYVVLLHSVLWSNHVETSTWMGRFLRTGYTAVGFFFVLSGYILAYVYLDTDKPFNRRAFWTSRFARVYPLLFASLLLDAPNDFLRRLSTHGIGSAFLRSFVTLLSECALLQSWNGHFRDINAPSWSLSAEAFFYFVFPFVSFWIWRRKGFKAFGLFLLFWGCALFTPLLVTMRNPGLFVEVDSSHLQWAIELMPIFRIFEFLSGIALCSVQKSLAARLTSEKLNRLAYIFIAVACILFVVAIEFASQIPLLAMSNGLLLPVHGLIILGLTNIRGWLSSLLSHRYLFILGESSYAVYLLHSPIWLYFSRIHEINTLSVWFFYVAIVIGASIASFFFLEGPARKKILTLAGIRPRVLLKQEEATSS
jgi:peptidoglycan/LPS O-acetylase OafA/YrhL